MKPKYHDLEIVHPRRWSYVPARAGAHTTAAFYLPGDQRGERWHNVTILAWASYNKGASARRLAYGAVVVCEDKEFILQLPDDF